MTRTLLSILALSVTAIIAIYAYNIRDIPFSPEAWKTSPSQRQRMIDSLLADHSLDGASRDDIDSLLGVPSTSPDSVFGDRYVYWAGTDGMIDDMWLEITFTDDLVADVRYVPD